MGILEEADALLAKHPIQAAPLICNACGLPVELKKGRSQDLALEDIATDTPQILRVLNRNGQNKEALSFCNAVHQFTERIYKKMLKELAIKPEDREIISVLTRPARHGEKGAQIEWLTVLKEIQSGRSGGTTDTEVQLWGEDGTAKAEQKTEDMGTWVTGTC